MLNRLSRWAPGRLALVIALALVVTACQAELDVEVVVEEEGDGVVTAVLLLDPESADALLDLGTGTGLLLVDLARAGWLIDPPTVGDDGWTRVAATKEFGTPEQLSEVLLELDGPDGVLRSVELSRVRSFARVDYRLSGLLDPTGGFGQFGDDELEAALGVPLAELAQQAGLEPGDVDIAFRVELPGDLREGLVTGTTLPGEGAVGWSVTLADTEPVVLDTATTSRLVAPLVLRGVAVVAAVLAGLVLLGQVLRLIRPESRRRPIPAPHPAVRARAPRPAPPAAVVAPPPDAAGDQPVPPKVVALDAMGVLYKEGDDVHQLLIPFARERGSLLTEGELAARARSLSLGRITPAEFWSGIGVTGEAHELDQEYLARHQLNPGVVRFLRALRERGIRAACVTNDAAAWATALRRRHSLEGLIDLWVISGSVGVRKPDPPIYEALRRLAQVPTGDIMVIDDDLANLDAARSLGFRTAWYAPRAAEGEANGHAILRSLDVGPAETTAPAGTA